MILWRRSSSFFLRVWFVTIIIFRIVVLWWSNTFSTWKLFPATKIWLIIIFVIFIVTTSRSRCRMAYIRLYRVAIIILNETVLRQTYRLGASSERSCYKNYCSYHRSCYLKFDRNSWITLSSVLCKLLRNTLVYPDWSLLPFPKWVFIPRYNQLSVVLFF